MGVWYCTRESVKTALDIKGSARLDTQVDRAIETASRSVDDLCARRFYPQAATRYFDWPNEQHADAWRLWLDEHEAISVSSVTSGGVTISASDYLLEPADGPPYDRIELRLDRSATFGLSTTPQRDIAVTGVFGHDDITTARGALAAVAGSGDTTLTVTDSTVGVGDLLTVDSEKIIVVGKSWTATGDVLTVALTSSMAADAVAVTDASGYTVGEELLIGTERMLIIDIIDGSNLLVVERGWDGSVLAAHDIAAVVYARRVLTVQRAALGTTAVGHLDASTVNVQAYPGPVVTLAVAEALNTVLQEQAGYARTVGSGEAARNASGAGLEAARKQCYRALGRKARIGTV